MARESRIKIDLLRLHNTDPIEKELVEYLTNEVSNSKRQEVIRTFLKAGYALLAKGQLPAIPPAPGYQPVVQTPAAPANSHMEVASQPLAAPVQVQQVDLAPASIPDYAEIEEDYENADESTDDMDADDPLAKMKAKLAKLGG